jgi:hypothetical protein
VPSWPGRSTGRHKEEDPILIYKWVEGASIKDYTKSAQAWTDFTGKENFITDFSKLVTSTSSSNEERAAQVESFILKAAVAAGVVKEIQLKRPRNPNKWGKTLTPWFSETCREAKREMARVRRIHGNGDERSK